MLPDLARRWQDVPQSRPGLEILTSGITAALEEKGDRIKVNWPAPGREETQGVRKLHPQHGLKMAGLGTALLAPLLGAAKAFSSMGDQIAKMAKRTNLTVGDIVGINKKGWEYMWVRYADAEDATAKVIVKKPVAVYVEKVYEEGNFAVLGIGT